jgi:hypothetical protein
MWTDAIVQKEGACDGLPLFLYFSGGLNNGTVFFLPGEPDW